MPTPPLYLSESRRLRHATFFLLYLVEGLPAGFGWAVGYHLAGRGLDPAVLGLFAARAALPWTFQFVWGPVVDRFRGSRMGERRPWVLGAQVLAAVASLGCLLVADPAAEVGLLAALLFAHGLCSSVQDTAVDALAIGVTPAGERGRANAFMRAGYLTGSGAGTVGFALLVREGGFVVAAAAHSGLLLLFAGLLVGVRERPGDALFSLGRRAVPGPDGVAADRPTVRAVVGAMWGGLLAARSLRLAGPVLVAYGAASLFFFAQSTHLIQRQGWADADLATFAGLAGTLAALGVTAAGGGLIDRVGVGRFLRWAVAGFGLFLVGYGLGGPFWAAPGVGHLGLGVGAVIDPLLSVAALPALMAICRRGAEGSQFTAYMALVNQVGVFGAFLAGHLLEATTAPAIGVGCGLAVLLAALVLRADD